jgi:hypothetical protein
MPTHMFWGQWGIPLNHDAVLYKHICLKVPSCVTHTLVRWQQSSQLQMGGADPTKVGEKSAGCPVKFEFQLNSNIWYSLVA